MGSRGQTEIAEAFAALVGPQVGDEDIDLVRAALTIALTEYPDLDIESYVARVDELAHMAEARISEVGDAAQTIAALNHVLFDEAGLRGNRDDYYDPRNSFLNDVLDRGLGIPISLSVVYLEVARRIGFPVAGIGMPGHFLLQYRPTTDTDSDGKLPGAKRASQLDSSDLVSSQPDLNQEVLIDCFNQGH